MNIPSRTTLKNVFCTAAKYAGKTVAYAAAGTAVLGMSYMGGIGAAAWGVALFGASAETAPTIAAVATTVFAGVGAAIVAKPHDFFNSTPPRPGHIPAAFYFAMAW